MSLTVAVLVRRIPDPERLQMDRASGRLLTEGVPFILNPVDRAAIELALRLKDAQGARVVVVTADEPDADFDLREALAMGCDEALLLSDPAFQGTDPTMHAQLFRRALARFVKPDIILASARSIDHTWSTVGPQVAALLDWPLLIEAEDIELKDSRVSAHAHTGAVRRRMEASTPCVVTVARDVIRPRHATSWGVAKAFDEGAVSIRGLADLELEGGDLDALSPRTQPKGVRLEKTKRRGLIWEGTPKEVGRILGQRLSDLGFAGRRQ
jgi:electron transfer flavoprotein beta subunit